MKKLISFFAFAVLMAATCVTATSCSDDDDKDEKPKEENKDDDKDDYQGGGNYKAEQLVGSWFVEVTKSKESDDWNDATMTTVMMFDTKGHYSIMLEGTVMMHGTFTVKGDKIHISYEEYPKQVYQILDLEEDEIILALLDEDGKTPTVFYGVALIWKDTQTELVDGFPAVDLGLPDGMLWAPFNVGSYRPEHPGLFYAWGETTQKSTSYAWSNYRYGKATGDNSYALTKYCWWNVYGKDLFTDTLTILDPADDAAAVKLRGGWRTPTKEHFQTLMKNCEIKVDTEKGVAGFRFISEKNGNSIFLSGAGYIGKDYYRDYGLYWTRNLKTDLYPTDAYTFDFNLSNLKYGVGWQPRYMGMPVRAVIKKK